MGNSIIFAGKNSKPEYKSMGSTRYCWSPLFNESRAIRIESRTKCNCEQSFRETDYKISSCKTFINTMGEFNKQSTCNAPEFTNCPKD